MIFNVLGESISKSVSTSRRIALQLREQIMAGDFPPGHPLREESLAAQFEISRNTLREALQQLVAEGLVQQIHNKGAIVRNVTEDDVRDIFRIRRALEIAGIEQSRRAQLLQLDALKNSAVGGERAHATQSWKEYSTENVRFHQAIVALLGSPRLDDFFSSVLAQMRLAIAVARNAGQFTEHWLPLMSFIN